MARCGRLWMDVDTNATACGCVDVQLYVVIGVSVCVYVPATMDTKVVLLWSHCCGVQMPVPCVFLTTTVSKGDINPQMAPSCSLTCWNLDLLVLGPKPHAYKVLKYQHILVRNLLEAGKKDQLKRAEGAIPEAHTVEEVICISSRKKKVYISQDNRQNNPKVFVSVVGPSQP